MQFPVLVIMLVVIAALCATVTAHFPVYSLYKERKPVDLALANARQEKRRAGGFEEMYDIPFTGFYPRK